MPEAEVYVNGLPGSGNCSITGLPMSVTLGAEDFASVAIVDNDVCLNWMKAQILEQVSP